MPLYLTGAHSSRITKSTSNSNSRRSGSLISSGGKTSKEFSRKPSLIKALSSEAADGDADEDSHLLVHTGKIISTVSITTVQDVIAAMKHATSTMFCSLPERAGMNSVRIAEVLNYQKNMPPLVSLPHIHALVSASSKTEREIQALSAAGRVRRLKATGRGNDVSGLSDVFILVDDYKNLLLASGLPNDTITTFIDVLNQSPRASSISSRSLRSAQSTTLTRAGFLVGASLSGTRNLSLSGSSLVSMPTISRSASGTSAAVGGEAAFERLGGVGTPRRSNSEPYIEEHDVQLAFSVPNLGPYLRLVSAGRARLLDLLRLSKHNQAPLYLLREKWDGSVDTNSHLSNTKKLRGEFSQVMPAKTKKWKELNGLNFDWALEECLGAGLIELFETHSVGHGVRALV